MSKNTGWFSEIIVDLLVTAVILTAVITEIDWLAYLIYAYTGLILAAKLFVLFNNQMNAIASRKKSMAPSWIYHLIYAANVVILATHLWLLTAAAWTLVWGASAYSEARKS